MVGYLAFPPVQTAPFIGPAAQDHLAEESATVEEEAALEEQARQLAWEQRCARDAKLHEERLAADRAQALLGEMEWVRSGGSLRDKYGRKDKARTEELRAEIRKLDEERRLIARWEQHEARWRALVSSDSAITFGDIPWPCDPSPHSVDALAADAIADFILAPLSIRGNTVTRKERIRTLLLRWHPDKAGPLVVRTVGAHSRAVQDGINAVFRCLKSMQDSERDKRVST